jgi:hypothetical protein
MLSIVRQQRAWRERVSSCISGLKKWEFVFIEPSDETVDEVLDVIMRHSEEHQLFGTEEPCENPLSFDDNDKQN